MPAYDAPSFGSMCDHPVHPTGTRTPTACASEQPAWFKWVRAAATTCKLQQTIFVLGLMQFLAFAGHDFSAVNEDLVIVAEYTTGGKTTYATQTITFTTNI